MIRISIAQLRNATLTRPAGYYEDVVSRGRIENGILFIDEPDVYAELRKKYGSNVKTHTYEWPIWAKALRQFSKPEDAGIGDVVARMIGDYNSMAFKAWHLATFGKACNCSGRQKRWNALYPLK
jgi:hypothetical protein